MCITSYCKNHFPFIDGNEESHKGYSISGHIGIKGKKLLQFAYRNRFLSSNNNSRLLTFKEALTTRNFHCQTKIDESIPVVFFLAVSQKNLLYILLVLKGSFFPPLSGWKKTLLALLYFMLRHSWAGENFLFWKEKCFPTLDPLYLLHHGK